MNSSRRPQPRRRRGNQSGRPAGPLRRAPGQGAVPAAHHQVVIDATNAAYWVAHMRESASRARLYGGPEAGDSLDLMADDLAACVAAGWHDATGRPVQHWQYHMWVAPHADGLIETVVELWPEHLAA